MAIFDERIWDTLLHSEFASRVALQKVPFKYIDHCFCTELSVGQFTLYGLALAILVTY